MGDFQLKLESLVETVRNELLKIGNFLINDGCIEIWNLVAEIDQIKASPLIEDYEPVFGGFCSQSGRLAGVMATMAKIGSEACQAAEETEDRSYKNGTFLAHIGTAIKCSDRDRLLKDQLQRFVEEFFRFGKNLQRLSQTDIVFIVCDARVLHDHPDLADSNVIRRRFAAATDHLETLSASLWNLAEESKEKAGAYEAALDAHLSRHKIN